MDKLVREKIPHSASVIVEVPLLSTRELAENYKTKDPDALIPDASIARISDADDARAEGINVCAEMLRSLTAIPGVCGANIRYQGDVADVVAAITAANLATG